MHCIVWFMEDISMNRASGTGFRLSWLKAVFRRQTLHSCVISHGKTQTQTVLGFFVPLDYRVWISAPKTVDSGVKHLFCLAQIYLGTEARV